jgi:hypothetical protein
MRRRNKKRDDIDHGFSAPPYDQVVKDKSLDENGRALRYLEDNDVEELGGRLNTDRGSTGDRLPRAHV